MIFKTGPGALLNQMTPADRQLEWLVQHNPHYLLTLPPIMFNLARMCLERGLSLPNLLEVETIGALLTQDMRETVYQAWGVPVVDIYIIPEGARVVTLRLSCRPTPIITEGDSDQCSTSPRFAR